jgi:very-short-patch-repair endonuclease
MAAVLSCGPEALLGCRSAAQLWGLVDRPPPAIEIVVPAHVIRRRPGIRVRRQTHLSSEDRDERRGIPVTSPTATLIDLAAQAGRERTEAAVNAADRLGLIDPEELRAVLAAISPRPGLRVLREILGRHTFTRTDSALERQFLRLVRKVGLPMPKTQAQVNGFRVDFHWPQLGLVVETDGLRYHRTPAQQARDLRREQVHAAAGLATLRFSAAQVRDEPARVRATLAAVVARLQEELNLEASSPLQG